MGKVEVSPWWGDISLGETFLTREQCYTVYRKIICSFARREAQRIFDPGSVQEHQWLADKQAVDMLSESLLFSEWVVEAKHREALPRLMGWAEGRTRRLPSNPAIWNRVEAVAVALDERGELDEAERDRLFRR